MFTSENTENTELCNNNKIISKLGFLFCFFFQAFFYMYVL